jgi:hypothetical protein
MEEIKMAGKATTTNKTNSTSAKTTKVENTTDVNIDLQKENEELKNKLESMMKMLENLQTPNKTETKTIKEGMNETVVDTIEQIDMNKRITVTSITTGGVNLKTSNDGSARQFRLDKLGQTLPIFYADLVACMNTDRWIFEEGLVYINDPSVVKSEYLEEQYKKFLDINNINHILDFDIPTIKLMISNTTQEIQETIISIIANKFNKGEFIDMNKVDAIEKSCKGKVDIREIANQIR